MARNNGNGGYSPYAVIVFLAVVALVAVFLIGKFAWFIISFMLLFMWFDCYAPLISTIKQKIIITLIALVPIALSIAFAVRFSGN
jgi:hypothetical protein